VPKLIISRDAQVVQQVELGVGRTTIGRHPHNDIVIAHQAVSSRHAAIDSEADMVVLEDLGSSNGTFVNGQRVARMMLNDGDRVTVATYELQYVAGESLAAAPPAHELVGSIEVMNGASAGKRMSLLKPLTTLGSRGVLVVVVSRHADGYYIAQVQGDGAGTVNDQAIGKEPRLLNDGDALELTGTLMRFTVK
jgi:hypothetical protein